MSIPRRGFRDAKAQGVDKMPSQYYCCVMIPEFEPDGNLPPGVHWATWEEINVRFGGTNWRRTLLTGLRAAADQLKLAGCQTIYLDGSFVTAKPEPGDFDGCWEEAGVHVQKLDPVLRTFAGGRAAQKAKFGGEFFPASLEASPDGEVFLDFFQIDKETGARKGIVALDLRGLT